VLDVAEVVESMTSVLRTAVSRTHPIEIQVQRPVGRVLVDRSQLERVLLNLALNARDAMPRGGPIRIAVREETVVGGAHPAGVYVLLEVADTGIGMDAATRERLFEPFFTTKPVGESTGLGLSVANDIVEEHAGWMSAQSEPGRGSQFSLTLPRGNG
jgi:signal transduction histidine kinase